MNVQRLIELADGYEAELKDIGNEFGSQSVWPRGELLKKVQELKKALTIEKNALQGVIKTIEPMARELNRLRYHQEHYGERPRDMSPKVSD